MLTASFHITEVASLSIQGNHSNVELHDVPRVVPMPVIKVLLISRNPELKKITYLLCWVELVEVPLTIRERVMVAKGNKQVGLRLRESLLDEANDRSQCVVDFLLAHPWIIVGGAITCPEHKVGLRTLLDLIQDVLQGMLWHVTAAVGSELTSEFSLLWQLLRLGLCAATVASTTVHSSAFLVIEIEMSIGELDNLNCFAWVLIGSNLRVESINIANSINWFVADYFQHICPQVHGFVAVSIRADFNHKLAEVIRSKHELLKSTQERLCLQVIPLDALALEIQLSSCHEQGSIKVLIDVTYSCHACSTARKLEGAAYVRE